MGETKENSTWRNNTEQNTKRRTWGRYKNIIGYKSDRTEQHIREIDRREKGKNRNWESST
jgi:hypothetical protein